LKFAGYGIDIPFRKVAKRFPNNFEKEVKRKKKK